MTAVVKTKIDDREVKILFRRLIRNSSFIRPALDDILGDLLSSIDENFQKEGRPKRWKPLKPATIKARRAKQQTGTKILIASGGLSTSINGRVAANKIFLGSNKTQARIHNLGGKAGRGLLTTIPQREFLLFQKQDIKEAEKVLADHLLSGIRKT